MTTFTPRTDPRAALTKGATARAFTLVEVMISATIATFVLAGVLSAFLLIGRSGYAASSYSELSAQMRRALDTFGDDVRKSSDLRWQSAQCITLLVATANGSQDVTYGYDGAIASATYGCFYRLPGGADSPLPRQVLLRNVATDFVFRRFKLEVTADAENAASSDLETKQIEVCLRAGRTGATTVAANQSAISARYILRNKRVSN